MSIHDSIHDNMLASCTYIGVRHSKGYCRAHHRTHIYNTAAAIAPLHDNSAARQQICNLFNCPYFQVTSLSPRFWRLHTFHISSRHLPSGRPCRLLHSSTPVLGPTLSLLLSCSRLPAAAGRCPRHYISPYSKRLTVLKSRPQRLRHSSPPVPGDITSGSCLSLAISDSAMPAVAPVHHDRPCK